MNVIQSVFSSWLKFQNIFKSHLTALERHLNRIMERKLTFADQTSPLMRNPRLRLLCNAGMMNYPALIYKMHNLWIWFRNQHNSSNRCVAELSFLLLYCFHVKISGQYYSQGCAQAQVNAFRFWWILSLGMVFVNISLIFNTFATCCLSSAWCVAGL